MKFEDFSRTFQRNLEHSALQMVSFGNEQPIADLISKVQSESFDEGFHYAIKTLQNNAERIRI